MLEDEIFKTQQILQPLVERPQLKDKVRAFYRRTQTERLHLNCVATGQATLSLSP